MGEVQRYTISSLPEPAGAPFSEHPTGDWVKYDDHITALEAQEQRYAEAGPVHLKTVEALEAAGAKLEAQRVETLKEVVRALEVRRREVREEIDGYRDRNEFDTPRLNRARGEVYGIDRILASLEDHQVDDQPRCEHCGKPGEPGHFCEAEDTDGRVCTGQVDDQQGGTDGSNLVGKILARKPPEGSGAPLQASGPEICVLLTRDEADAILNPRRYMDTVRGGRQHTLEVRGQAKIAEALEAAPPFDPEAFEREKAAILRWLEQFDPAKDDQVVELEEGLERRRGIALLLLDALQCTDLAEPQDWGPVTAGLRRLVSADRVTEEDERRVCHDLLEAGWDITPAYDAEQGKGTEEECDYCNGEGGYRVTSGRMVDGKPVEKTNWVTCARCHGTRNQLPAEPLQEDE